jgi:hypothetical protein
MAYNYQDDPILGPTLAYWRRKRGSRSMPSKRDIDATAFPPKVLPHLQIVDVIDGGARFRFRLVGTALVEAYGEEFTDKCADELFPDDRLRFVMSMYEGVCKLKVAHFSRTRYYTTKNIDLFSNRIYMPLSDDGINVHHILAVLRFDFAHALDVGIWGDTAQLDHTTQYIEPIQS